MRAGRLLAVTAPLCALLLVGTALPGAAAVEVYPRPADGSFTLAGKGFGHGLGMSQHGARGAATLGLTHAQILDFYYPGTTLVSQPDTTIRVWVKADTDNETRVLATSGRGATAGGGSPATLPARSGLGGAITLWRVTRSSAGLRLSGYDAAAGQWLGHAITASGYTSGSVTFTSPSGLVRLALTSSNTFREYRGGVRAIAYGSSPGVRTLAVPTMEQYLRAVVPSEMPASWPAEALRAQSVAARTYASRERHARTSAAWDTCDDSACQVFAGTATYAGDGVTLRQRHENPLTDQAVAATATRILQHHGIPAFTQFSSSNGGWTVAGNQPYQVAKADPYDGVVPSTASSWTATLTAAQVQSAYPAVGTLRRLRVTARDGNGPWGGRVRTVSVEGSSGSVQVGGEAFRLRFGLRSAWWLPTDTTRRSADVDGDGLSDVLARVAGTGQLLLYGGDGTGGFRPGRLVGTGWQGFDALVAPGDWDGDTAVDVIAREAGTGRLWLYPGDGAGGWKPWRVVNAGWQGFDRLLGAGDWDGDGRPDLLAREAGTGRLLLYPGDGAGGIRAGREVGSGWQRFDEVLAVGDWDGDGAGDVMAREAGTGRLWLYPGDGRGGWRAPRVVGEGFQVFDLMTARGDWDGDGAMDLIARESATGLLRLYSGNGAGGWASMRAVNAGWQVMDALP
ncbi:MAG TPA: SpoIID/LytB domain-containing protein [Jiangellales bacterium]|nr:SpoIID/LytB domain-containing protein [Jiangellales bacterium]